MLGFSPSCRGNNEHLAVDPVRPLFVAVKKAPADGLKRSSGIGLAFLKPRAGGRGR